MRRNGNVRLVLRPGRFAPFAIALLVMGACAHQRPYALGQGPSEAELLALAKPQIDAIQVPQAKVVLNRSLRGDMAFIAQAPGRFRGGVTFAGNELVTLAFHEEGYSLRYKLDAFPVGFYEGPPDDCAVRALLGISIDTDSLVSFMLGGAPLIVGPFEVVAQGWSRKQGWEALVIRNASYVEELRFTSVDGRWQFIGGEQWVRSGEGKGQRLWSVEHKSLDRVDGAYLPERTLVSTPGNRKDTLVTIIYKERNLHPAFAAQTAGGGGGDDGGGDDGGGDDGGWDDGAAGDDGGWENDTDDGWENDTDSVPASDPAAESAAESAAEAAAESAAESAAPPAPPSSSPAPAAKPSSLPEIFRLVPGTLTPRGDLCRTAG